MTVHKQITLELAPPRRLFDDLRYRSFKLLADRQVWARNWDRVLALEADGWQVDCVAIDWGSRIPLTPNARTSALIDLIGDRPIACTSSGQGKGKTVITLSRVTGSNGPEALSESPLMESERL
jgi:hypothetical protein